MRLPGLNIELDARVPLGRASARAQVSLPTVGSAPIWAVGSLPLAGYSGPLFDYNREGDAATGTLSSATTPAVAALESGVNRLRLSKTYDMIGTIHGTQATTSSMPVLPSIAAVNGLVPVVFQNDETNGAVQKWFDYSSMGLDRTNHSLFMVIEPRATDGTTEFFEHSSAGTAQMAFYNPGGTNGMATRGVAQKFSLQPPRSQLSVVGYVSGAVNIVHYCRETSRSQATTETSVTMGQASEGKSLQSALLTAGYYGRHSRFFAVAYPTALSDADAQLVMAELRRAFNVPTVFTKRFVFMLDSIMVGYCTRSLNNIIKQLTFPAGSEIFNVSITGQTAAQVQASTSKLTGLYKSTVPMLYFCEGGTNDIFVSLSTGTTVYSSLSSINTTLKALGANVKTGQSTILPRVSNVTPGESERLNLNPLIIGNVAAHDFVIDWAADATMGAYASLADTTLYAPDKIHPTALGDSYLVALMQSMISSI